MENVPLAGARVSLDVDRDGGVQVRGLPPGIQLDTTPPPSAPRAVGEGVIE
jgi:hypothetical protein